MGSQRGCWQGQAGQSQAPGKKGQRWRPDGKRVTLRPPGSGPTTHLPTGGSTWCLPQPGWDVQQEPTASSKPASSGSLLEIGHTSPLQPRRSSKYTHSQQACPRPELYLCFQGGFPTHSWAPSHPPCAGQRGWGVPAESGWGKEKAKEGRDPAEGVCSGAAPQASQLVPIPPPARRVDQEESASLDQWKGQRDPAWYPVSGKGWMMFYKN